MAALRKSRAANLQGCCYGNQNKTCLFASCIDIITAGDYERLICLHLVHRTGIRMQPHYTACLLRKKAREVPEFGEQSGGTVPPVCTALKRLPASPHGGRAAGERTQLFLIGNSAPMADLHSGACTSLNPWPCQTQPWGEGRGNRREKQEGGEAGVKRGERVEGRERERERAAGIVCIHCNDRVCQSVSTAQGAAVHGKNGRKKSS